MLGAPTETVYQMTPPPGPAPLPPGDPDHGWLRRTAERVRSPRGREAATGYLFLSPDRKSVV